MFFQIYIGSFEHEFYKQTPDFVILFNQVLKVGFVHIWKFKAENLVVKGLNIATNWSLIHQIMIFLNAAVESKWLEHLQNDIRHKLSHIFITSYILKMHDLKKKLR